MNKLLIGFLILSVVLLAIFFLMQNSMTQQQQVTRQPETIDTQAGGEATDFPEPSPGAIVFDMKYRGLSGEKGELRCNSYRYWDKGPTETSLTPFLTNLKDKVKDFDTVYNPCLKGAEWSAVEIKDNKVVASYIDLNADGKVSDNEKLPPIEIKETSRIHFTLFVTPDFVMKTRDNRQVPFRALLHVNFYWQQARVSFMWSPSCVLEGTSTLKDKPTKLILFSDAFTGDFHEFGSCSYYLQDCDEPSRQYISDNTLSSIINYKGQFYNLKLSGKYEKDKRIRVELEEYDGATGKLAIQLKGDTNLETKLSDVGFTGVSDKNVHLRFNEPSEQTTVPVGIYKLCDGKINYGVEKSNEWRLGFNFTEEPEFTIDADQTCNVELGKPVLFVRAVEENKRYDNDVKEKTVYPEGTNIFISGIIKVKGSEFNGRFYQLNENSGKYDAIEPELKIVDSKGEEVAAAKIKYG